MTNNGLPQLPRIAPRRDLTADQEARRREITARNDKIQKVGPRPLDGVTFAKRPGSK